MRPTIFLAVVISSTLFSAVPVYFIATEWLRRREVTSAMMRAGWMAVAMQFAAVIFIVFTPVEWETAAQHVDRLRHTLQQMLGG